MIRKSIFTFALALLMPCAFAGCGGSVSEATTGTPAPLTEEQKAEIKTQDQQIDAEEQGDQYNPKKKR